MHYPRRLYCTQYQETDWEFVTRILAEEGILFYFHHLFEFEGGLPAKVADTSDHTFPDVLKAVDTGAQIVGGLAGAVGSVGSSAGSEETEGAMEVVGAGAGMISDLTKALSGVDEAPMIVPERGTSGPDGGGDVFHFTDAGGIYPYASDEGGDPLRLVIDRTEGTIAADSRRLESIGSTQRTAPDVVEIRDYDFHKPLLLLKQTAGSSNSALLEQYEHHGEYETPDIDQETANIRLEQHRRDAATWDAKGRSPMVLPGYAFELVDPDHRGSQQLVVVRIHHEFHNSALAGRPSEEDALVKAFARAIHEAARSPELAEQQLRDTIRGVLAAPPEGQIVYQNFFTSVAREVAYRPPRPERVMRNVTESATVMGPVGNDIFTDRHGRVKVQFHWDREGKFDDNTSVWMRVLQPWAGAGYGFQFFPRVGMEVLVTFLGGDPDRPVVLGSLYNGTHPTPEPLPDRKTRSGIRTQSSPKGGGFNELSFDDAKGEERVYLHAERDYEAVVNHSHELKVKHAHTVEVGARQHIGIEGEQMTSIGGMQATVVGQDQTCTVGGSRRERVVGNFTARREGNVVEDFRGMTLRAVESNELTMVVGSRDVNVYHNATTSIGGQAFAYVQKDAQLNAKIVHVAAEDFIRFRVGDSFITVSNDGVRIEGDTVSIVGRDQTHLVGEQVQLMTPSGALMRVHADRAFVRGAEIELTSPEQSGGPLDPATHPPNLKLKFTHLALEHGGEPIANTRYMVTTPTRGLEDLLSGTTNGDGELELHVPDGIEQVEIDLWVGETYTDIYPNANTLRFVVAVVDSLGEIDEPRGLIYRLRNMGYQPSTRATEEPDPATRQALLDFQLEAEIARTGRLDDRTKRKLRELYGS
jgi:type VI secretion system secreted protein VgrG